MATIGIIDNNTNQNSGSQYMFWGDERNLHLKHITDDEVKEQKRTSSMSKSEDTLFRANNNIINDTDVIYYN